MNQTLYGILYAIPSMFYTALEMFGHNMTVVVVSRLEATEVTEVPQFY